MRRTIRAWILFCTIVIPINVTPCVGQKGRSAIKKAERIVVMLQTKQGNIGAGIVIGFNEANLFIATARHVVLQEDTVTVKFKQEPESKEGIVISEHQDVALDLAIVRIPIWDDFKPKSAFPRVRRIKDFSSLQEDDGLYAIGNADPEVGWDRLDALTINRVAGVEISLADNGGIITGYSGGALFTDKHRLIGMVREEGDPYALALSIERIAQQVRTWNYPLNVLEAKPGNTRLWAGGAGLVVAGFCLSGTFICKVPGSDLISGPPSDKPPDE